MAKYQIKGFDGYIAYLKKIGANTKEICGKAVYAMAEVAADEVRAGIKALPAVDDFEALVAYRAKKKAQLTDTQKKGLEDSFGISPMDDDDGFLNVKIGFDGYNDVKTKSYPNGQPNAMIARATESGSSVREKNPFLRKALNKARKPAMQAGQRVFEEALKEPEK